MDGLENPDERVVHSGDSRGCERAAAKAEKKAKRRKGLSKPAFLDAHSKFFGMSTVQFSETRWWSRFDVIQFLFRERARLRTFLQGCVARGVCKKTAFVVFVCVFVFLLF
jgi:hypothetical protein